MFGPRSVVNKLTPCTHGGIDYAELRRSEHFPETILDFSVSCNPFGPPPGYK